MLLLPLPPAANRSYGNAAAAALSLSSSASSYVQCHAALLMHAPTTPQQYQLRRGSFQILAAMPARDRKLEFGKHKGKLLGTLPQNYLRWMAKSLKKTGAAFWADLAEEVLQDPHYQDRLEWEKLEQTLLKGGREGPAGGSPSQESLMRAFGWDLDNRSAWSKVKFSRLGTSEGGRIPRVPGAGISRESSSKLDAPAHVDQTPLKSRDFRALPLCSKSSKEAEAVTLEEDMVMSRRRMRRNRAVSSDRAESKTEQKPALFPGRRALVHKISKGLTLPP
ncbi:hypothetical protein O6H91_23G037300 [Diphasiastrum complanatum]|uniref:Uncharacterized protein n=3 Tax=Diphasiastrum complanatum TaxID=34168 RepID=A0ACC2A9S0_DIPCM|nr:hypothetical protein O6H91_23G037000 [Diphasiastrum complanatum]KAJ7514288.1 hypothetical protein O6H91_23G037300 [Diphasiastrum complanatum]